MKSRHLLILIALFASPWMLFPSGALAADDLSAVLSAHKVVVSPGGKQTLLAADKAQPGDVIEYEAVYSNRSQAGIKNLMATIPIPAGMEYIPGSAKPAQVMASLDGKKFEAVPLKRTVTLPNGKQEQREVPYEEYRFVRWTAGDMAAGSSTIVSARTRMSDVGPAKSTVNENASTGMTSKKGGQS